MRVIMASSALLAVYLAPYNFRNILGISLALCLYIILNVSLFLSSLRWDSLRQSIKPHEHWIDVGLASILIACSNNTFDVFFLIFLFAILTASFQWGLASGLVVTAISSVLFVLINLTFHAPFESGANIFFLRLMFLLVLGYMASYWGGAELEHKRRLLLLNDVTTLSNPRFGVDHTIGSIMERLRVFYDASSCLLIMADWDSGEHLLRRADSQDSKKAIEAIPAGIELEKLLLASPASHAVVYDKPAFGLRGSKTISIDCDATRCVRTVEAGESSGKLKATLDAESFISIPVYCQNKAVGRLYLTSRRRSTFNVSDVGLLTQVMGQVMPVIENIRLVDRLASDAADNERQRIARDIHDSVIQPYIGIQLGLVAVRHKLEAGCGGINNDIESLINMTDMEISGLRRYMGGLSERDRGREVSFLSAVKRFAEKFAAASGISVDVQTNGQILINDRLAAEAFQIIAEGLSNIRRHTNAARAWIEIESPPSQFVLRIKDDAANQTTVRSFTPRSITARVASLGGRIKVEQAPEGGAIIDIIIPL